MGVGLSRPLGESPLQAWPDSNVFHWAMRLLVVFCLMTAHVLAGDTAEDARRLLAGVREARGALRRGVYQADGDLNLNGGLAGPIRDRVAIFCAFDFDKALFRIDRTAPLVLTDPSSGEREIRTVATSYVKTPQGIRYWDNSQGTSDSGSVSLYPQD